MKRILVSCSILSLLSCRETVKIDFTEAEESVFEQDVDSDNDGYLGSEDCNDDNLLINPGAVEICDGVDNDCDGLVDEEVSFLFYLDGDEDDYGDPETSVEDCEPPDGYVTAGNDCDDTNSSIFPSAPEECNEVDDNCDGQIDEGLTTGLFYDADGDGHGDPNQPSLDCNDSEGFVYVGDDCDDTNPDIHPFRPEICDDIDNDCDGQIDEGANQYYYADTDGDGFGSNDDSIQSCVQLSGYVENNFDCNDDNPSQNPDAAEYCNSIDDDCNGVIDDDSVDAPLWYYDIDGDGYGS